MTADRMPGATIFFSCFGVIVAIGAWAIAREFGLWKWLGKKFGKKPILPMTVVPAPQVRPGLLRAKPAIINEAKTRILERHGKDIVRENRSNSDPRRVSDPLRDSIPLRDSNRVIRDINDLNNDFDRVKEDLQRKEDEMNYERKLMETKMTAMIHKMRMKRDQQKTDVNKESVHPEEHRIDINTLNEVPNESNSDQSMSDRTISDTSSLDDGDGVDVNNETNEYKDLPTENDKSKEQTEQ